jgi:N-glycosylase/DNA lyase
VRLCLVSVLFRDNTVVLSNSHYENKWQEIASVRLGEAMSQRYSLKPTSHCPPRLPPMDLVPGKQQTCFLHSIYLPFFFRRMRLLIHLESYMVLLALACVRSVSSFLQARPILLMRSTTPRSHATSPIPVAPAALTPETPLKRKRSSNTQPAVVTPGPTSFSLTSEVLDRINAASEFQCLGVSASELRPSRTLTTGQCFHWTAVPSENDIVSSKASAWGTHDASEWIGTLRFQGESVVLFIRETPTSTLYRPLTPTNLNVTSLLHDYFQLDESLSALYQEWSTQCPRLKIIAECLPGVRIVNQDPLECLISFICSSNNNIPRITKMLAAIRREYGRLLLTIGDESFYSFPSLETLQSNATEQRLRELGLGYRAKYLIQTIQLLADLGGELYLHELRLMRDAVIVQEKLVQFSGVGRKVADCVALFSLKQDTAIPVDVHVWNIARRDYDAENVLQNVKSITPTVYNIVGELFRNRFINKSGWAHSLLFVVSRLQLLYLCCATKH